MGHVMYNYEKKKGGEMVVLPISYIDNIQNHQITTFYIYTQYGLKKMAILCIVAADLLRAPVP